MRQSWFAEFFAALPDALRALWEFGDPEGAGQGWWGIIIFLIWGVLLTAIPLLIAERTHGKREWVTVTMTCVAGFAVLWWLFGIIPSAWVFFADAHQAILGDAIIPTAVAPFGVTLVEDFYNVIRDSVVVVWHVIAVAAVIWAALRIQERFPRDLAPGEDRPTATGGYR